MCETLPLAVSIEEAARMLGISRTLLYDEIKAGRIKTKKIGSRTIIEVEELRRYLRERPS